MLLSQNIEVSVQAPVVTAAAVVAVLVREVVREVVVVESKAVKMSVDGYLRRLPEPKSIEASILFPHSSRRLCIFRKLQP